MTRFRASVALAPLPLALSLAVPLAPATSAPAAAPEEGVGVAASDPKGDVTGSAEPWLVGATDVRKVRVEVAPEPVVSGDAERLDILTFEVRHGRSLLGGDNAHLATTWFAVGKRSYKAAYGIPRNPRMTLLRKNAEGEWVPVSTGFSSMGAGAGELTFSVPVEAVGTGELRVRQTVLRLKGTDVRDTVEAPEGSIALE
ncbi:hypothetical protein QWY28_12515 [Nocardioides sp. SOB77]|uniref:DUF4352 domain-containing protein n=1 Tax=Nocardioides oceani TaxID=3058369 RepID=A0ABT8FGF9_9ACTN|nr:hypothetical protein [Nocardioides oceani]MDN4173776.1 hypothetical protein [Nocardioides oceani]